MKNGLDYFSFLKIPAVQLLLELVKLGTHRFVYEAEVEKDGQTGEITVDAEGNIVEELKWDTNI
jgi:uncharacterized membrane protein YkoI